MSDGLALYRKYRPATFAEVKGQDHVTAPLRQALATGRINHAYLFSGPRGCGKTSSARIMARSLNCVNGPTPDPCGVCESCVALAPSGPGSIDVIEIDAASHGGVDDARDLRERAFYAPVSGRYKIYIIDEAHMVTQAGFNALLKLVEEPPPHLVFIFATTEPEKVIGTIRSRTHHYPFRLFPPSVLRDLLAEILDREGVPHDPAVLPLVARAGAGSARDSLSILDQLLAGSDESGLEYQRAVALLGYTDAALLDEIVDAFVASDGAAVFRAVNRVIEGGHEPRRFALDLLDRLRDLIVLASVPDALETGLLDVPPERTDALTQQASRFGMAGLTRAAEIVSAGLDQMRGATSARLLLELMCAQVLLPAVGDDDRSLLARLEKLERGLPSPMLSPPQAPSVQADPAKQAPSPPAPAASVPAAPSAAPTPTARPAPQEPAPGGPVTADVLTRDWNTVLETVKARRRVAWILLSNATVVTLDDGLLTLRFPRPGDVKGFASSGYEDLLKGVLTERFGLHVMIKAISGGDAPAPGRTSPAPAPAPQPAPAPAATATPAPAAANGPGPSAPSAARPGPASRGVKPQAHEQRAAVPTVAPRASGPSQTDDGNPFDDDPLLSDYPDDDPAAPAVAEVTGVALIQRELGGEVVSEYDEEP